MYLGYVIDAEFVVLLVSVERGGQSDNTQMNVADTHRSVWIHVVPVFFFPGKAWRLRRQRLR